MTTTPEPAFLGGPPDPTPSHLIGRIATITQDPHAPVAHGTFVLISGTHLPWITHTDAVREHADLFRTPRVIVTVHNLGGPLYLTGIRHATPAEWDDARAALNKPLHVDLDTLHPGVAASIRWQRDRMAAFIAAGPANRP